MMRSGILICLFVLGLSLAGGESRAQSESLLEWLVARFGLSANPSQLKGAEDEVQAGQIWVKNLTTMAAVPLTEGGGYRSPIFDPVSRDILALKAEQVVRLPAAGGQPMVVQAAKGVDKLVAVDPREPDRVLVVTEDDEGRPVPALLSLADGTLALLAVNWESEQDIRILDHLLQWNRSEGTSVVAVRRQRARTLSGTLQWTDIFLMRADREPVNLSNCEGVNCGQPALSPDGKEVVFIKEK